MSYTCIACRVAFPSFELQRSHYKTDWHRYNLKRKVAELPPVSADVFQQKVLVQRDQRSVEVVSTKHCKICNKKFSTDNAYTDHLKSKKHRESEVRLAKKESRQEKPEEDNASKDDDDDVDEEVIECEGDEPLEVTECLFCEHESQNVEENVKHMARSHSFFIPEVEYLLGLKNLIGYLGAKVGMGHVCIWCNRPFASVEAVRHHMVDKGHTFMLYNDSCRNEYVDFYDFRSSYPDYDPQNAEEKGEDQDSEVEDDGQINGLSDGEVGELVLPSGARVGHRALRRYYRQSLPGERPRESRARIQRVIAQYRAVGWTSSADVRRKAMDKQRTELDAHTRSVSWHHQKLGLKANRLQKHFRSQNFLW